MPTATRFPEVEKPENTRGSQPTTPSRPGEPDAEKDLLALAKSDPEKVCEKLLAEWNRSVKDRHNYNEQWKVNLARSEGYLGASLDKVQDRQEAWIPYGTGPSLTGLNKAARLSRRLRSAIFADPPVPDVVPSSGRDISADNAQFQERILQDESSEGRLGYDVLSADAFEVAKDYGSGFLHFYIDPEGRGPEPVQIKAHPDATSADDPLLEQPGDGQQPPAPKAPVLKYVTAEGGLTFERQGQPLKQQFLPKLCAGLWTGRHVGFLPNTARDLWDATGVLLGGMVALGDVKAAYPSVAKMTDEELAELVRFRPEKAAELLPMEQRKYLNTATITDSSLVFQLLRYQLSTAQQPHGSYFALIGEKHLAYHGEWWDTAHDEALDLPLTQFMQYRQHGNPYGQGSTETLGPGGELLAIIMEAMLEHMDRFGDAKTFVPTTQSVRPEQLEAESHRYIPTAPGAQPTTEQIPDFPITFEKMYGRISTELDDESALGHAGQAQQAPNVKSARHFQANLAQVQVLLSDLRQNTARGLVRGWRIMGQQIRARYTIPQLLRWQGEDGAYHVKEWSGADLIGIADIKIAQGSFTQMLPVQKATLARELYLNDRILTAEQYRRIVFGQFDALLALEEDPHFQRVKRQIDRWLEGPPAQEVMPSVVPQAARAGTPVALGSGSGPGAPVASTGGLGAPALPIGMQAPAAGAGPSQPPPNPFQQQLNEIFDPRPADDEPQVAQVRMQELGRTMATTKFSRFPKEWQAGLVMAYQAARQASQVADAKQLAELQKHAQELQQKLQTAEQKPHLSLGVKLADLDPAQSAAVLQQEGLNVPQPVPVVTPVMGPRRHKISRQPDGSMIAEQVP
jgi:hypothetical protein